MKLSCTKLYHALLRHWHSWYWPVGWGTAWYGLSLSLILLKGGSWWLWRSQTILALYWLVMGSWFGSRFGYRLRQAGWLVGNAYFVLFSLGVLLVWIYWLMGMLLLWRGVMPASLVTQVLSSDLSGQVLDSGQLLVQDALGSWSQTIRILLAGLLPLNLIVWIRPKLKL